MIFLSHSIDANAQNIDAQDVTNSADLLAPLKTDWLYAQTVRLTFRQDDALWSPDDYLDPNGSGSWWVNVYENKVAGDVNLFLTPYVYDRASSRFRREQQLTTHPGNDLYPHLSEEAASVVFSSDRNGDYDLYRINPKTLEIDQLTNHPALDTLPKWSPDSTQIAFISNRDGDAEIYLLNTETLRLTQLTFNEHDDVFVEWSPSGNRLIWVQIQRLNNEENEDESTEARYIYSMNADGSDPIIISPNVPYAQHLHWSPDGRKIAFDFDSNGDGANDLAVIESNVEGIQVLERGYTSITDDFPDVPPEQRLNNAREVWAVGWSPSGELWKTDVDYSFIGEVPNFAVFTTRNVTGVPAQECCVASASVFGASNSVINQGITNVHIQNSDPHPSVTQIKQLPEYSRGPELLLQVDGYDPGYAGVAEIQLYTRVGSTATWPEFYSNQRELDGPLSLTPPTLIRYEGAIGETVALKSVGRDREENREQLLPNDAPDAKTTLFQWRLSGYLTDSRGYPLPERDVTVSPAVMNEPETDVSGYYEAYVDFSFPYSVMSNAAVDVDIDRQQNAFVGTPQQTLLNTNTVELDVGCGPFCLTADAFDFSCDAASEPSCFAAEFTFSPSSMSLVPDRSGGMHLLWHESDANYHRYRDPSGIWSARQRILASLDVASMQGIVDTDNRLHILANVFMGNSIGIYHTIQTSPASWAAPVAIGEGLIARVLSDERGPLHLLAICTDFECDNTTGLFYHRLSLSGTWQEAEAVIDEISPSISTGTIYDGDMGIGPSGHIHFIYRSTEYNAADSQPHHRIRKPTGQWTQPLPTVLTPNTTEASRIRLHVDDNDSLHLFWTQNAGENTGWFYTNNENRSVWSSPMALIPNDDNFFAAFSADRTLHTFYHVLSEDKFELKTQYRPAYSTWLPLGAVQEQADPSLFGISKLIYAAIDSAGRTHALVENKNGDTGYYVGYADVASSSLNFTSAYSVTLTVNDSLQNPTLSFLYDLYQPSSTSDGLSVTVSNGITETQVYTRNISAAGHVGWVDLSQWAGEEITATFAMASSIGAAASHLRLHTIALDEWGTPIIDALAPNRVDVSSETTITVRGKNFDDGILVTLDDMAVTNLRIRSSTELQFNLPSGVDPGVYNLRISSADGIMMQKYNALQIGELLYLPVNYQP